jgi:hypothetical protein
MCSACTSVQTDVALPSQGLADSAPAGTSRVFFYNTGQRSGLTAAKRIGIKLDGQGVGTIAAGQYVRIDVAPGRHHLELSFTDTLEFRDPYSLTVPDGDLYVRLYCTELSAMYNSSPEMPPGFAESYRPLPVKARR